MRFAGRLSIPVGVILLMLSLASRIGTGQTAAPAEQKPPAATAGAPVESAPKLTEKQKALADQADKLLALATELKQQVDRTNKNILSVKVVKTAEEIEQYARRLKDQAKR